ncbi:LssY C-terminal domain-containing protein [Pigmentiphaga sp. GD03639]|nr:MULTISPECIES: LssY C-terminal domain-containing protein [unclassified Pigmentiphaga]MDH2239985.1 LssY C-terminal domain-containing protein [Pigmentiphaga sp. GD03639]
MNKPSALDTRWMDGAAASARALLGALALSLLSACAGPAASPKDSQAASSMDPSQAERSYLDRANRQAMTRGQVTVSVAALRDEESAASFGLPLAEHGVQPVWVRIENRSTLPYWFMPVFMDRDFYSAREAAYLFHSGSGGASAAQIERQLTARQIKVHVPPGQTVSGFVYTNVTRGIKLVNVELLGARHVLRFDFARELPGGGFDYQTIDPERLYQPERRVRVDLASLGSALQKLPCCTTNAQGSEQGDPLNLVMVGSEHDVLVALVRAGWDFTETINASSVGRMIGVFAFGGSYRTSPVSALHFAGRPQDFSMQRARASISQRNHLRLWLTPLQVDGVPVWAGQISRDIGVKVTTRSPTLTTHVIDPDVDEARDYLLQDMLMTSNVARWGYVDGVGEASQAQPRANLAGDPYFTDGRRLVLFVAQSPRAMQDAEFVQWHPHADGCDPARRHCGK